MPTEETLLKRAVRQWLDWHGWFHFHLSAGLSSYAGAPDRIAIKQGRVVCLELKATQRKLSPTQERFAEIWRQQGGEYYVIYSLNDLKPLEENTS